MVAGASRLDSLVERDLPEALRSHNLGRRAVPAFLALAAFIVLVLIAPGLGEVRQLLEGTAPGWLAVGILFECLSVGSYIVMFGPIFCAGLARRRSWQIGGSELALGSLIPTSGIAGLGFGAWILHRGGMDTDRIAGRSVAFFLISSAANFTAVAVLGGSMVLGLVGPDEPPALTAVPAGLALLGTISVAAFSRYDPGQIPRSTSRLRRIFASGAGALAGGSTEAIALIRSHRRGVLAGSLGYWAFDNAVLWAAFRGFDHPPPISVILLGYLLGQLGGLIPIPGGVGGLDGGLIGALVLLGANAADATAAVLVYRIVLFWIPLVLGGFAFVALRREMPSAGEFADCAAAVRGQDGPRVRQVRVAADPPASG